MHDLPEFHRSMAKSARLRSCLYLSVSFVTVAIYMIITVPMHTFRDHGTPRKGNDVDQTPRVVAVTVRLNSTSSHGTSENNGAIHYPLSGSPDWECPPAKRFMPAGSMPYIALLSVPGSGNTWLRYLVEGVTGIYTGSRYSDDQLMKGGFIGESEPPRGGRVVAVKMHLIKSGEDVDGVIYLIRNPYDAIIADYNRICSHGNHTGAATEDAFKSKNWTMYARWAARRWENSIRKFMKMNKTRKLVIYYEDLLESGSLSLQLRRILSFLNITIGEKNTKCILTRKEGYFHRRPHRLTFDPFTEEISSAMDSAIRSARKIMETSNGPLMKSYERDMGDRRGDDGISDEELEKLCPLCKRLVQW